MPSFVLWLALSIPQLQLTVDPAAGYAPLRVTVTMRVTPQPPSTDLCLRWVNTGDPDDPTRDYAEESLSCQTLSKVPFYHRMLVLTRGEWKIDAYLDRADGSRVLVAARPVRVLPNSADPR